MSEGFQRNLKIEIHFLKVWEHGYTIHNSTVKMIGISALILVNMAYFIE